METRPDLVKISVVNKDINAMLVDRRGWHWGQVMGTIASVAKQYGIEVQVKDKEIICSAPKSRMQMFVEKLHFAGIKHTEL